MAVVETLARAAAIIGTAFFAFIIGVMMWAALSGAIAGVLDGFGIHLSASMLLALGPVAGAAVSIGVVKVVFV